MTDLTSMRISYARGALRRKDLKPDPLAQFGLWFEEALQANLPEPYAMQLATASAAGRPSVRTVLLRGINAEGLTFYTNFDSHKGRDLAGNPQAEVVFYWAKLERQIRAYGPVVKVPDAEAEHYFHVRPRDSQLAAHASDPQSQPIANREALEAKFAAVQERFSAGSEVPKPDFWGGYRVQVQEWEFWQGRPGRLHDRFRYVQEQDKQGQDKQDQGWLIERLMP